MAIINALQFDQHSGAMISDEEYWLLRRRKSYFSDNLHVLLDDETADWCGIQAVWGACGTPSFGAEVVDATRRRIRKIAAEAKEKGKVPPFKTLREVAMIGLEETRKAVRRRVNDKLRFLWGFEADDLIRGNFKVGGKRVDIKQSAVKKYARDILEGSDKRKLVKDIFDNRAVVMGLDEVDGFGLFYIDAHNCVLSTVKGGFDAIGTGKYASGQSLNAYLSQKTLAERRAGHDRVEATFQLLLSGVVASRSFQEVGGDFHLMVADNREKGAAKRMRFVDEDRTRLAVEAVTAVHDEILAREAAHKAIDDLIFGSAPFDQVETGLFQATSDAKHLELSMRGYKTAALPNPAGPVAARAPAKGRKKKGK